MPRGLLPGTPIDFDDIQEGDVIDTYSPVKGERSRFHKRMGQKVLAGGTTCDINTDYDMICVHLGLWIQLVSRDESKAEPALIECERCNGRGYYITEAIMSGSYFRGKKCEECSGEGRVKL